MLLFIGGVLGMAVLAYDDWDTARRERAERQYRSEQGMREAAFRQEQRARETMFNNQVASLAEQQSALVKEYDRILMGLATNGPANPALIASLASAKEKYVSVDSEMMNLKSWVAELGNRRDLAVLQAEQESQKNLAEDKEYIAPYLALWDYAMKRLFTDINAIADRDGATLSTEYRGLPTLDELCTQQVADMGWNEKRFPIATLTFSSNTSWKCDCSVVRIGNMRGGHVLADRRPRLLIECQAGTETHTLVLWEYQATLYLPGSPPLNEPLSSDDFKKGVDRIIRNLIAAEAEALGIANN